MIDELSDYAQYHFSEEEAYMTEMDCHAPFREEHVRQHADFITHIGMLHKDAHYAPERFAESAIHYLVSWLAYHILDVDQSMARQIQRIRAGATPEAAYLEDRKSGDTTINILLEALIRLSEVSASRATALGEANEKLHKARQELELRADASARQLAHMTREVITRLDRFAALDKNRQAAELDGLHREIAALLGKPPA
jgi:hemerythrin